MHLQYNWLFHYVISLKILQQNYDLLQNQYFGGKFSLYYCHFIQEFCGKMYNIIKFEGGFATCSTTCTCRPLYSQNRSIFEN